LSITQANEYTTITVDIDDDGAATITLARPDLHNAFNETLIEEISNCVTELSTDGNVRLIILTGEGKSFCAGADINWMKSMVEFSHEENIRDSQALADMFKIINECPKPVVGRINGAAFGGGVGLVAVCDVAVAADNTRFSFSEVKLGIIPAVISPYVISRVGPGHARRLFITGERFDAETAYQIGLVHRVVFPEELDSAVAEVVEFLMENGPEAMHEVKKLVAQWQELDREEFRKYTVETIARLRTSPEGRDGLTAFLEKRKPSWRRS
jgi:methylglutaconyl-CoA hydratase